MSLHKTVLDDRGILRLTGPDSRTLLQGLITQNVDTVTPASAAYGSLLTPQGKFLADFFLIQIDDDLYLDCHLPLAEMLFKKLRFYKLRANVEISDVTADWTAGLVWGDSEADMPHGPAGQLMGLGSGASRAVAYTDPRLPALGLRFLSPTAELENALNHFDCPQVPADLFESHAMALGVPLCSRDIHSEQSFPLDVNLDALNGIDYSKGCFVGQEVASRMKRKGEIRKRLWKGRFTGSAPAPGTPLKAGDQTIGDISSTSGELALIRIRLDRHEKAGAPSIVLAGDMEITLALPEYLET